MIIPTELRRLLPWEECVGVLIKVADDEDALLVKIGKTALALPTDMAEVLRPHVGQRIAILRTDSRSRPYRFRSVDTKNATKNSHAGAENTGQGDENCAQTTGVTE